MHIEVEKTLPNGAVCTVHRISMIVVEPGRNTATINSYAQAAIDQAAGASPQVAPLIGWQDRVEIPDAAFTTAPMTAAAEFLIGEGAYLAGGTIVEDAAAA